jgi:hypothetical protein
MLLLQLSKEDQLKVHRRDLAVAAAVVLAKADPEKREEVRSRVEVQSPNPLNVGSTLASGLGNAKPKEPTTRQVVNAAREAGALPVPVSRKASDWKAFWEPLTGPGVKAGVRKIATAALKWQAGEIQDTDLEKVLNRNAVE